MKVEVVGEQERERERAVVDCDMLIYEPQGFSLTISSFTETQKAGEKNREKAWDKQSQRKTNSEMQNRAALTERMGCGKKNQI